MIRRLLNGNGRRKPVAAHPPATIDTKEAHRPLRVLTYNIHHGRGTDGKYDLQRIAKVIASQKPDIVGLQEVDQYRLRTHRDNQPQILAEMLGMNYAFARVIDHGKRDGHRHAAYGNAILSRFPVTTHEHFNISYEGAREPRGCLHATLDVDGTPLHVFCVHLGLRYRERHFQVERLLSDDVVNNDKFGNGPKIMLGDFNNWWPVKTAKLVDLHFKNACLITGRKRLQTFGRFLSLDYIYASHDLSIVSCEVIKNPLAKVASDHSPLMCSVAMNGSARAQRGVHEAFAAVNSP